jgi:ribosomal protein L11 methyltransferase
MNYLQFDFETESREQMDQLIALLDANGFSGFGESGNILQAFIPEEELDEQGFSTIIDLFSSIIYTRTIIDNINWNKKWEESFTPVIIDDFVAIRANFHEPILDVQYEIIITPKMSFGTGHHATTYLMMQQMQQVDFFGKSVIDFGTGTGVLAILAEKMGATKILAIDNDEWSIQNAKENILQNNCHNVEISNSSYFPSHEKYDVILVNVTLNVISDNLASITLAAKKGTTIILSGFFKENEMAISNKLIINELTWISTIKKDNWLCIFAEK